MKTPLKKRFKHLIRGILGLAIIQWPIALLFYVIIWFVYFTSRREFIGENILKEYKRKPAIVVFWHGRSMMLSAVVTKIGIRGYAIASAHKDGRAIAKLEKLFGLKTIYGSTSEGGVSVLRKGVKALRSGKNTLVLSPDGPSGPSMRFHDGALYFAKMSGAPIIPVCFSCSRPWFQKRWDRYLIAKPFSKIKISVADPIFLDENVKIEDFEKIRKSLENIMVKQLRNLDKEFTDFKVEQDMTASEFKAKRRELRKQKKIIK